MVRQRSASETELRPRAVLRDGGRLSATLPRVWANPEKCLVTRSTTSAQAMSREREERESRSVSSPSWRRDPRVAAMWPWDSERTMAKESVKSEMAVPPLRRARRPSIRCGGHLVRLRIVRLQTLPSLRKDSRRRIAGGEERLGTRSIYTGAKPSIEQNPTAVR